MIIVRSQEPGIRSREGSDRLRAGLQMVGIALLVCLACGRFPQVKERLATPPAERQAGQLLTAPMQDVPPAVAPVELARALAEPLTVKLQAPVDTIAGNWVPIEAIATGSPTSFAWNVIAAGSGQQGQPQTQGLLEQGAKAHFSSAVPGDYIIECAAANGLGQVAMTSVVVTLLSPPPVNPLTAQSIAEITPQTDLNELHRAWVAEVATADRLNEAAGVAESFREIASLLDAGAVEDMTDPLLLVERSFELSQSPAKLRVWGSYFSRVRDLASQMQGAGALETTGQFSTLFKNLAGMLDVAAGRQ